jgi:3-oxoacyl-[acyl-carrier protein] reductase
MRLANKIAIVTGGSRGIGQAIALAFAREGARVTVVSREKARADAVVAKIARNGGEAIAIQADVSSETDVTSMVAQTMAKWQGIDILVNGAAVNLPYRVVTDLTLAQWNWILSVNLTGTFLCCRAVVPPMKTQGKGKIINFASIGGRIGAAGRSPYRATKAAIINFTECLAAEVKEFGIDVNGICPGTVDTDMIREITEGKVPKHAMPPEDIAAIAVFLASEESRAITATCVDAFGLGNPLFGLPPAIGRPKA